MTERQLEIIQHALGCNEFGKTSHPNVPGHPDYFPYHRNHFCAGVRDEADCRALVEMGFMQQHRTTEWLPYFNCSVTQAGMTAMREESKPEPKLTRSQQRYRAFLDADSGETFIDWLRSISHSQRRANNS
jgi:hypothetical protein